ncbi:MAG: metallophosphoesterase, partial [Oligoflexia bacterium]|nr:metallophosphoesterase [Oligoflexia bacterium]
MIFNLKILFILLLSMLLTISAYGKACTKHVLIGDLHGSMKTTIDYLVNAKFVDKDTGEFTTNPPDDTCVVFAGDYIDRGEHSLEVYQYLDDFAKYMAVKTGDPNRVIRIIGNHELEVLQNHTGNADPWADCKATMLSSTTALPGDPSNYPVLKLGGVDNHTVFFYSDKSSPPKEYTPLGYFDFSVFDNSQKTLKKEDCDLYGSMFDTDVFRKKFDQFRARLLADVARGDLRTAYHFKAQDMNGTQKPMVVTHAGINQAVCDEYTKESSPKTTINPVELAEWLNDKVKREAEAGFKDTNPSIIFRGGDGGAEDYGGNSGVMWNRAMPNCAGFGQVKGHDVTELNKINQHSTETDPIFYVDVGASEGYARYGAPRAFLQMDSAKRPSYILEKTSSASTTTGIERQSSSLISKVFNVMLVNKLKTNPAALTEADKIILGQMYQDSTRNKKLLAGLDSTQVENLKAILKGLHKNNIITLSSEEQIYAGVITPTLPPPSPLPPLPLPPPVLLPIPKPAIPDFSRQTSLPYVPAPCSLIEPGTGAGAGSGAGALPGLEVVASLSNTIAQILKASDYGTKANTTKNARAASFAKAEEEFKKIPKYSPALIYSC